MSRTLGHGTGARQNGRKSPGYEYWSGRPGGRDPRKDTKTRTHRIERQQARRKVSLISLLEEDL